MFETLSAATATALAQIIPVFLVALIAERIVPPRSSESVADREIEFRGLGGAVGIGFFVGRLLVDFCLALAMIIETFLLLNAIEIDGYDGERAELVWITALGIMTAVVYRWFLLSTPVRDLLFKSAVGYFRAVARLSDAMTGLFSRLAEIGDGTFAVVARLLDGVSRVLFFAIEGLSSVLFGALSGGVELIVRAIRDRRRGRDSDHPQ